MLKDSHSREFPYLRLSITDVCNFSCAYCLPDGYKCEKKKAFLSIDELRRLVTAFSQLGVWKIRITGGEPTVRKDFAEIANMISNVKGVDDVAFTTNGYRLRDNAKAWKEAGLSSINVSIDSLQQEKFHQITGHNRLDEVLQGVHEAIKVGFERVKVNAVLLKNVNDNELSDYLSLIKNTNISVRFIELMQTGDNFEYFHKYHVSVDKLKQELLENGWVQAIRSSGAGPAVNFTHLDYLGNIGFIAPYSKDFCKGCNRLRTTATGDLRLCLFGESGAPLRHLLQEDGQIEELKDLISTQLNYKKSSHFLLDGNTGITPHLASVGG